MYLQYFGLSQAPFSITPDPRFVFLSARHEDALAHLKYGITEGGGGGFVQLTGEVGTGKTTLSRCLLEELPENISVALILNSKLPPLELLEAICDELKVSTRGARGSQKKLIDRLNRFLLKAHGQGRNVVLMIDEAQNLSPEALEQVRLLTNLETATKKLLQIVLLGQPELRDLLARADLRQLAQRITARFHLTALSGPETADYLGHRLKVAGAHENLFSPAACRSVQRHSGGVPRLINIVAERALVATYAAGERRVSPALVNLAASEVMPPPSRPSQTASSKQILQPLGLAAALALAVAAGWWFKQQSAEPAGDGRVALSGITLPAGSDAPDSTVAPAPTDSLTTPDSSLAAPVQEPEALPAWVQPWETAFDDLARRAGQGSLALPDRSSCPPLTQGSLRCRRDRASAADLASLNRPVLLQLSASANQYALVQFTESAASVLSGESMVWLDQSQIESRWSGLYLDLFSVPGYVPDVLREGDRGPGVLWLKSAASRAEPGYLADPDDPYFGPALRRWAETFQATHGLPVDGLVGIATIQRVASAQAAP